VTGDKKKIATLPCNPSIGGPAKGIVVREIDALGGAMAKLTDQSQIQIKMLNTSKGPAVRALRAQVDKLKYPRKAIETLYRANVEIKEALVERLIVKENKIEGVILKSGEEIFSNTVILTTGTHLNSSILIGHEIVKSGPNGDPTTYGISKQLKELGFEILRLKTGTPPRIKKESINTVKMTPQFGDKFNYTFSHENIYYSENPQELCFLTHTNDETHNIINSHLGESSMYSGIVEGVGARYCPSIEDKVVRFYDKQRHQVFVEPESVELDELYLQGLSTSMPRDVQEKIVKSVAGLENAIITKYAYAIEYDAINPTQLKNSLETKNIENLFCAGQINGTSGYEEAAAQGLIAGINAAKKILNKEPLVLMRNEAYIGVLVDDLVTKGVNDPYRLLTSRAEYRLLLRHDNADFRLTEKGFNVGLVDIEDFNKFIKKKERYNQLLQNSRDIKLLPTEETNSFLENKNSSQIYESISLYNLLKRPEIFKEDIVEFLNEFYEEEVLEQLEINVKYEGYIEKSKRDADKMLRLENKIIPGNINYEMIRNISSEGREKLNKIKPQTIGQASRISGVNPADISILVVYIESGAHNYELYK
jgi:tRNA uridine 5-carboxymethylaminomethyl modification enzyme